MPPASDNGWVAMVQHYFVSAWLLNVPGSEGVKREFRLAGRRLRLGASIGISLFPADAADGEALLRNADAATYRAKQVGRNQIRFFARAG